MMARCADVAHVFALPLVQRARISRTQHLGEADDRIERRSQLVAHVGEKSGLCLARGLGDLLGMDRPGAIGDGASHLRVQPEETREQQTKRHDEHNGGGGNPGDHGRLARPVREDRALLVHYIDDQRVAGHGVGRHDEHRAAEPALHAHWWGIGLRVRSGEIGLARIRPPDFVAIRIAGEQDAVVAVE